MSEPLVEARGLAKSYASGGGRLSVVRDLTFSVAEGELVAIMGASGVGKSTLLHLLGALDVPDEGAVFFDGRDIFELAERERNIWRNRAIGFVFQFHHLLPEFTAIENVMMPLLIGRTPAAEARARAMEMLDRVGIAARSAHRPAELSGGEQQRVAVVRALATGPRLVLADEPTGNLDSRTGLELIRLFRELHQEKKLTTLLVTHSEKIASQCDRVLQMDDGRLKDAGS